MPTSGEHWNSNKKTSQTRGSIGSNKKPPRGGFKVDVLQRRKSFLQKLIRLITFFFNKLKAGWHLTCRAISDKAISFHPRFLVFLGEQAFEYFNPVTIRNAFKLKKLQHSTPTKCSLLI